MDSALSEKGNYEIGPVTLKYKGKTYTSNSSQGLK